MMRMIRRDVKAIDDAPATDSDLVTITPLVPAPAGELILGAVRAAVVDQTGVALAGVRVTLYHEHGNEPVATTLTDDAGHALFVVPPARYRLRPIAAGLKPSRFETKHGHRVIVMEVDSPPEVVELVSGGKTLSFRMDDSIDPEYYPPSQARAWLKFSYCVDVESMFRGASANVSDSSLGLPPWPFPSRPSREHRDWVGFGDEHPQEGSARRLEWR